MSYLDLTEGIQARLSSIPEVQHIYHGEPVAVQVTPFVYFLFDSFERVDTRLVAMRYTVMIRALVQWHENERAERELAHLVNAIPDAFNSAGIDSDGHRFPTLGGRVNRATIVRAESGEVGGFFSIGGITYRGASFVLQVDEKAAAGTGI